MAKCKNLVILIGHVGKDAELKFTTGGAALAKFSLATSEKWKDKQTGEWVEKTEWHNIVAWGKTAEYVGEYTKQGDFVYIEGKIQTRSWEGDDGNKHYMTEIVATGDVITLRSKAPYQGGSTTTGGGQPRKPKQNSLIPPTEDDSDDIPF